MTLRALYLWLFSLETMNVGEDALLAEGMTAFH